MAARRAATALQDAFSVWAAYTVAMSPATAVHHDDAFLAPRDSEVSSGLNHVAVALAACFACNCSARQANDRVLDRGEGPKRTLPCMLQCTMIDSRFGCTQRDRHVVTNLAAMLGNVSVSRSESAAASNDGSGVFDARRAASNYLRRAMCHSV